MSSEDKEQSCGLLMDWDPQVVSLFVEQMNLNLDGRSELPEWIRLNQSGKTSQNLLMTGIVDFIKERGSSRKSFGCVFIAPTGLIRLTHVNQMLAVIERNAFMQVVMKATVRKAAEDNLHQDRPMYLARLGMMCYSENPGQGTLLNLHLTEDDDRINLFY